MSGRAWRSFDAFAKPMEGVRTQSAVGGFITLLASCVAALLFLCQVFLYWQVDVTHSLHLAESNPLSVVISNTETVEHVIAHAGIHSPDFVLQVLEQDKSKIPFHVHITFPHIKCKDLDFSISGASLSNGKFSQMYGRNSFITRIPSDQEINLAISGGASSSSYSHHPNKDNGCTLFGTTRVAKTGGSFTATVSARAWAEATRFIMFGMLDTRVRNKQELFNLTHYIHDIRFGPIVENRVVSHKPLTGLSVTPSFQNHKNNDEASLLAGVFLNSMTVKLIPTRFKRFARRARHTYQTSVASHIVRAETLANTDMTSSSKLLPGLVLNYDLTPIAVHHTEQRQNIFVFFSSLVSIVGGVFVTVSLLSSCLVNSAAAVSKKMD